MNDFQSQYTLIKPEIDRKVSACLDSGWYILGQEVETFEKQFADYIGTKYAVGVANGLEAMQIAFLCLGIGGGDEVITVANSAVASALSISATGARPVFVDIDPETQLLNASLIEKKITERTKAILPVHLFGQAADMEAIRQVADKHQLKIIEDACQAHGASWQGKKVGSFGDAGCFSFYPTKNLGAFGDGGMITTDSQEVYEEAKMLRNYGQKNRYEHEMKGINSRLDELQAAVLQVKLKYLDEWNRRRRALAKEYDEQLKEVVQVITPVFGEENVCHLYVIRAARRNELMQRLKDNEVHCLIHYPIPIHKQKAYEEYHDLVLRETEKAAGEILSLPIHPQMKEQEVEVVCSLIKSFYE